MMVTRTLSASVSELVNTIILKIAGGDLALICLVPAFQKGKKLTTLDKVGLTTLLDNYKV